MESPCINICILDEQRGLCRGCYRTLDEIGNWGMLSAAERQRVMASLAARRKDYEQTQQDH
jgi:hypothetical protein